jgi:hypothetical protein
MSDASVEEKLLWQSAACAEMGSTLYAKMLECAAAEYRAGGPIAKFFDADPRRAAMSLPGLRLLGALHFLALDGSAPELAAHFPSCGGDGDAVAAWHTASGLIARDTHEVGVLFAEDLQTNEVARATVLLAGLHEIHRQTQLPIRLLDIGASAGLNARLDRYRYEGDGWSWGDPASPLVLRNSTRSGIPALIDGPLPIVERAGVDVRPLDVANARHRMRLISFVWPDQPDRVTHLKAAFDVARHTPLHIERANVADWLDTAARPRSGLVTVVMHSVVLAHLDADAHTTFFDHLRALAAQATDDAPFAWLRMESDEKDEFFETRVTLWPHEHEALIAISDGHAQDIAWHP